MTSLYILANEYKDIEQKLNDSDMDEQTVKDTLEGLSGELETKGVNVAYVIRNMESSAEQIKQAEKAMADRRKALESRAEQLKRYLKDNMERTGITKIECPHFSIAIKHNPPAVVIDDAAAIPSDYMVTPPAPPPAPDKKLIAQAIKDGFEVPGCKLVSGTRVDIK
jgi:chromosome segregation ATPase